MVLMKRLQSLRMNGGYVFLHWRPNGVLSCFPKFVCAPFYGVVWWFNSFLQSCVTFLHKIMCVHVFSENQNCVWTLSCGCGDFPKWPMAVSAWWLSFTNRVSSLLKNQTFFSFAWVEVVPRNLQSRWCMMLSHAYNLSKVEAWLPEIMQKLSKRLLVWSSISYFEFEPRGFLDEEE